MLGYESFLPDDDEPFAPDTTKTPWLEYECGRGPLKGAIYLLLSRVILENFVTINNFLYFYIIFKIFREQYIKI